jgi:hypothetical protein
MILRAALALALLTQPAQAATIWFCWVGANDYSMSGRMEFPDELLTAPIITEADITAFQIKGYRDGVPIGSWDLRDIQPWTTWYLRYWPDRQEFPVNGAVPGPFDQGWNADGTATDCGPGGFGFNAGNYAQDFCLNGVWLEDSGVPPPTPFLALTAPPDQPDCRLPALIG